ncbi:hypothetical protein PVAR5_6667 [Paecilomyces variotii No. 5]|uniref:Uncharacterized protein n=1 Tax=Byssochlamys spectabilis (strain No. 5 / NBRC 109023) TaxID=1356009 RepID=V5FJG0_BYSSN|nr:hypothetical protein PVAR5_6667 [Paecilomyces variotii No. 5]
MSLETTTYNVYRVRFTQRGNHDHEANALVPVQNSDQFGAVNGYKDSTFQYQIVKSKLDRFEEIAAKHPPPYDPRVLTEREPHPPARNCANWVDDVLDEVKRELV